MATSKDESIVKVKNGTRTIWDILMGIPTTPSALACDLVVRSRYWNLAFFILATTVVVTLFHYWKTFYLGVGYPGNTFLFMPADMYGDFFNMVYMAENLDAYNTGSRSGYPPFGNLFFWLFSRISYDYQTVRDVSEQRLFPFSLVLFLLIPVSAFTAMLLWRLRCFDLSQRAVVIICVFLLNYPFLFAVDRANLDLYVLVLMTFFILGYTSSSETVRALSAFALGLAIALKIYPVLFALVYIKDRRYHDMVMAASYCILLTVGGWAISAVSMRDALLSFLEVSELSAKQLNNDWLWAHRGSTTFFSAARLFAEFQLQSAPCVRFVERYYSIFAMAITLLTVFFVIYGRLERWRVVGIICCLVCGIPKVGNDYRLTLLLPFLILANEAVQTRGLCRVVIYFCVGLLLVPKNIYYLFADIGVSSLISGLLLFLLLLMLLFYRLEGHQSPKLPDGILIQ